MFVNIKNLYRVISLKKLTQNNKLVLDVKLNHTNGRWTIPNVYMTFSSVPLVLKPSTYLSILTGLEYKKNVEPVHTHAGRALAYLGQSPPIPEGPLKHRLPGETRETIRSCASL